MDSSRQAANTRDPSHHWASTTSHASMPNTASHNGATTDRDQSASTTNKPFNSASNTAQGQTQWPAQYNKSLNSIEEESPRWLEPPQPQPADRGVYTNRDQLYSMHQNVAPMGMSDNDSQPSLQGVAPAKGALKKSSSRHVQSLPTLTGSAAAQHKAEARATESNRVAFVDQRHHEEMLQSYDQRTRDVSGADYNQRIYLGGFLGQNDLATSETQRSGLEDLPVPKYEPTVFDTQKGGFSDRQARQWVSFFEKVQIKGKASDLALEVKELESIVLTQIAREMPDLAASAVGGQVDESLKSQDLLDSALVTARNLRDVYAQYCSRRKEQAFNQLVDGLQVGHPSHRSSKHSELQALLQDQTASERRARQSIDSVPENAKISDYRDPEESTINAIKMGSLPSDRHRTTSSQRESRENLLEQVVRQHEHELLKCNGLIERLKQESANLELTVVDQRQEIQSLCNKLKQSQMREQSRSHSSKETLNGGGAADNLTSFACREQESLVRRLKEELRQTHEEGCQAKEQLQESTDIIGSLQKQVASLKHRLVLSEDASRSQFQDEFQQQLKEMADLRFQNEEIAKRCEEMAHQVKGKEDEMADLQEKSKQMMIEAQKDAQECIKYFKSLAFKSQTQQQNGNIPTARSHSPRRTRNSKGKTSNPMLQEAIRTGSQFPTSLGPVPNARRIQNKSFKPVRGTDDCSEYVVNGIKLKMNKRVSSTIEAPETARGRATKGKTHRSHTLSPMSASHRSSAGRKAPKSTNRAAQAAYGTQYNQRSLRRETDPSTYSDGGLEPLHTMDAEGVGHILQAEVKLECAMNALIEVFHEIGVTKRGISEMVQSYGEQYCAQLQKFSVLAYDYLERVENIAKRESQLEGELATQKQSVQQLKDVTMQQTEHIEAQNQLILEQKNQLSFQQLVHKRITEYKDQQAQEVRLTFLNAVPDLRDTITGSHVALLERKKTSHKDEQAYSQLQNLHDLSKKKIKILEEELEKSLQTSQMLEDTVQANRKKFNQLVDLIKDIWQDEMQQSAPQASTISYQVEAGKTHHTLNNRQASQTNHGSTSQAFGHHQKQHQLPAESLSDLGQTTTMQSQPLIGTQAEAAAATGVPMPISWLSDISEHIKLLKEMNDQQTDEVFQIVGLLQSGQETAPKGDPDLQDEDEYDCEDKTDLESCFVTRNHDDGLEDDQTTEGEGNAEERKSVGGGPPNYGRRSNVGAYLHLQGEAEESETERNLDAYHQRAQNHNGSTMRYVEDGPCQVNATEETELYVRTSECVPNKSRSQDRKEMSFSQKLDDSAEVIRHHMQNARASQPGRSGSQMHSRRASRADFGQNKRRDRSQQPSRNFEWPDGTLIHGNGRVVETQRVDLDPKKRSSLNVTARHQFDRYSCGPTAGAKNQNVMAAAQINNYRGSIDFTATMGTLPGGPDGGPAKRNELYAMLREEVIGHLRQTYVKKSTILSMKRKLKDSKNEIQEANRAFRILHDEKDVLAETKTHLEGEIKDLEYRVGELQGEVQSREAQMINLKHQIEDFEKELLGLQEQMTHVMKLNQEIGMASEHWETSFNSLKEQTEEERSQQQSIYQSKLASKARKIGQLKQKLQEKERVLKTLQDDLAEATEYRNALEMRKQAMVSIGTMTEPALELLEQHKAQLETKLGQVKQDVSAVLDQVEKEQVAKGKVMVKLAESKETNKSLVGELNQCKKELKESKKQGIQLKKKHTEALETQQRDKQTFDDQIERAERLNTELQQQVAQVTRAAEELQDQYARSDELQHNAEIQEQKINQLEEQVIFLQAEVDSKARLVDQLQTKIAFKRSPALERRETRSVSVPRIAGTSDYSQGGAGGVISEPRQEQPGLRGGARSGGSNTRSKNSTTLLNNTAGGVGVENNGHTLLTNQSIFDEENRLFGDELAAYTKPQNDYQADDPVTMATQHDQSQQHFISSVSRLHRNPSHKPPKKTFASRKASTSKGEQSDLLDISPINTKTRGAETGAASSAAITVGSRPTQAHGQQCCCKGECANRSSKSRQVQKQTAIDDLQSSYNKFKVKQEVSREAKRKVKKAISMAEVLCTYFMREASQISGLEYESSAMHQSSCDEVNGSTDLSQHVDRWAASQKMASRGQLQHLSERQVIEAKAYFNKRGSSVLRSLECIVEQVAYQRQAAYQLESQDQVLSPETFNQQQQSASAQKKEPPQIVSYRGGSQGVSEEPTNDYQDSIEQKRDGSYGQQKFQYGTQQSDQAVNLVIDSDQKTPSITNHAALMSLKSPVSSCRNCTATFHQTQSLTHENHSKVLFQKFMKLSRSLAGICYGGCIFMGDQLKPRERYSVDYALSFLAKDAQEFESGSVQSLDELWTVVDGLLTTLSGIISGSCQHFLKAANTDQRQQQQAFESIAQKSIELSMDKHHMVSQVDRAASFELDSAMPTQSIDLPGAPVNTGQNASFATSTSPTGAAGNLSTHCGGKLLELESRMKNKFASIKQLETLLDSILGRKSQALLPQLAADLQALQKVFANIKRVISKLKIELHQDYLHLGQVNLQFQSQASKEQHNSSMQTTFDLPNQNQTLQSVPQPRQTLAPQIRRPQPTTQLNLAPHIASPRSNNDQTQQTYQRPPQNRLQMRIGSQIPQPHTTNDSQPGTSRNAIHEYNGYHVESLTPPRSAAQNPTLGLATHAEKHSGTTFLSRTTSPFVSLQQTTSLNQQHQLGSARFSQTSGPALTAHTMVTTRMPPQLTAAPTNSTAYQVLQRGATQVERILEDLQGLTFDETPTATTIQTQPASLQTGNIGI